MNIKIGDRVWVGSTDDFELDEWLDEQDSREIIVEQIEDDYLWGRSYNTEESCPYHIEVRDLC